MGSYKEKVDKYFTDNYEQLKIYAYYYTSNYGRNARSYAEDVLQDLYIYLINRDKNDYIETKVYFYFKILHSEYEKNINLRKYSDLRSYNVEYIEDYLNLENDDDDIEHNIKIGQLYDNFIMNSVTNLNNEEKELFELIFKKGVCTCKDIAKEYDTYNNKALKMRTNLLEKLGLDPKKFSCWKLVDYINSK